MYLNNKKKIIAIKEKPKKFISKNAITGLYFFDNKVVNLSKNLKPSKRNELEITDLLNKYRQKKKLTAEYIGRGGAWLDTGSIEDFYKHPQMADGHLGKCKECNKEDVRQNYRARKPQYQKY